MKNEHLEIFLRIVDTGSISAAAEQLSLTQSTVSSALASVEREAGKQLIVRSRGQRTPLLPTKEGLLFYQYAQDVLRLWEQLQIQLSDEAREQQPVRLIAGQTLSVTLLAGMLKFLKSSKNEVDTSLLVCHVNTDDEIHLAMQENLCDFVFVTRRIDDESLICEPILEDPIILICNRSLSIKDEIDVSELCELPLVLRESTSGTMAYLDGALHEHGLSIRNLKPALTVYGASAVRESVKYGSFCGFVPLTAYRPSEDIAQIRIIRVKGFRNSRTVYLLHRREACFTPQMKLFRRFVFSGEWRSEFVL